MLKHLKKEKVITADKEKEAPFVFAKLQRPHSVALEHLWG